ncbi:MAG: GNAT family N-acetyltransferase [Rhodospirillaceae bacterium]|nr:GNAT family N-acetyltransferase [Rhodospirillaceae bacterium]
MNDERDRADTLTAKVVGSIAAIDATAWDACAGQDRADRNPFVRHAFYCALEESGSVSAEAGWQPQHVTLEDAAGRMIACAAMYLKTHSYGEYVFDWGWAQAYQRAGGRYYPKLQCAVPFTPVTGPRLMTRGDLDPAETREAQVALLHAMLELTKQRRVSSLHVTFPTEAEQQLMAEFGFLPRIGEQYHWKNEGYGSFDDFLNAMNSRKRKNIRKEREKANSCGVRIETLVGADIKAKHWDAFYRFYIDTSDRKWGQAYLTREFFDQLSQRMPEAVVLVMGFENDSPVCGAINLRGGNTLFGRNWGAKVDYPFLHFECCYYRAIDYAIAEKLDWVEAGAQGQHKIQRGYLPRPTYSAHWIADPGFRDAVARFLDEERDVVAQRIDALEDWGPFKKSGQE